MRLLLQEKRGVRTVREVESATRLCAMAGNGLPTLVLLDWELPEMRPRELLTALHRSNPQLAVIAFSSQPAALRAAVTSGAQGFVCKSDPPEKVLAAFDACLRSPPLSSVKGQSQV